MQFQSKEQIKEFLSERIIFGKWTTQIELIEETLMCLTQKFA